MPILLCCILWRQLTWCDICPYKICEDLGLSLWLSRADVCARASTWRDHQQCHHLRDALRACSEKPGHGPGEYCWAGGPPSSASPFLLGSENYSLLSPMSEVPWVQSWTMNTEEESTVRMYACRSWLVSHIFVEQILKLLYYLFHSIHLFVQGFLDKSKWSQW